jgi:hypothetical protein
MGLLKQLGLLILLLLATCRHLDDAAGFLRLDVIIIRRLLTLKHLG